MAQSAQKDIKDTHKNTDKKQTKERKYFTGNKKKHKQDNIKIDKSDKGLQQHTHQETQKAEK